jgi:hypothetical protein
VSERVLSERELNRALLARQLLLERAGLPIPRAVERVGGLQTQYAPSAYVGLWTRLAGFEREALTQALERRSVIQGTLMRGTIHVVSRREYWLYASGIRRARREWWLRTTKRSEQETRRADERLRAALADGPRSVKELGEVARGPLGHVGLWVDVVRVPPSGTWERRRADRLGLAEDWVGPCDATEEEGLEHLVRAYLRGCGPATAKDVSSWAGVPVKPLEAAAGRLRLRRFRDERGRELLDLPRAALPPAETPVPVRFLPHWDANLLVHARRTQVLPERHRERVFHTRNPFSTGTVLVDGAVAGGWQARGGRVELDLWERLPRGVRREVEDEAAALESFHA